MTYCVGIQVPAGLVFASDTRTSASFDDVRVHTKMHAFEFPGERSFVVLSAGNLGTTQAVLARLQRDLDERRPNSLQQVRYMFEAAEYVGQALVAAQGQVASHAQQNGISVESTLILGGQIGEGDAGLFLIYPLGNCIAASPETPYLQIGESKYGKPILDRIIDADTSLEDAARCALVSLDSTIRSNVSVGLPIDLAFIRQGELKIGQRLRLDAETPLYRDICNDWSQQLDTAVRSLPRFAWEQEQAAVHAESTVTRSQAAQQQQRSGRRPSSQP